MSLPIFPLSPLPGGLQRTKNWGENTTRYDSGEQQSDTAYVRPLYDWVVPLKLLTEIRQSSVWFFIDTVKGTTSPFLLKDAYDYQVSSVLGVRSGITNAATLWLADVRSFKVRADTTTISSLFSALSGYVRLGIEYSYEQDTGIITVNTKATTDVWGVRSMEYYRKAKFSSPYQETSPIWNTFNGQLNIVELP
jgi:hypothetical protein